jgi:hypothetical protein
MGYERFHSRIIRSVIIPVLVLPPPLLPLLTPHLLPHPFLPVLPVLTPPLLLRKMSTTTVSAMAAMSAGAPLTKINIELAPLQADEVEIKISHCGVCASDHHLAAGNWGP